ncbi:EAL domain-containing protein [Marinobacteraceae bacterium S3BR75-40.1]
MRLPVWIKRLSISRRLTLLMMTTATVALLLGGLAFVANDLMMLRNGMLERQATLARIVGLNSVAALDFNDRRSARETLDSLGAHSGIIAAAIYDSQGKLFARYQNPEFPHTELPAHPQSAGETFTLAHLETFQPISMRGQQLGTIFVRTSTQEWFDSLYHQMWATLTVLGLVGLISFVLSHFLQRSLSSPIKDLAQLARKVSHTRNYRLRARKWADDELGSLADDFNTMLEEIQHRDAKLSEHGENLERQVRNRTAALEQLTHRLEHQAHHDSLTGLPNRKRYEEYCFETLTARRQDKGQFAIMFLDLERFKLVNDSLGHHFGDRLLKIIAKRLKNCIRETDIVARQGGDEFTILLPLINNREEVRLAAERILAALVPRIELNGHTLHITGSIGISLYPQDGDSVDELLRHADTAMYSAKAGGGNDFHFFSREMQAGGAELLSLEAELRTAIREDQLELAFQPIVASQDGRVRSFEALVRWRHPEMGVISPGRFIPMAEETGLIMEIDEWVFRAAARQVMAWRQTGRPDMTITVNLSSRQFNRPNLPQRLQQLLEESGAVTQAIELEITEGMLMHHTDQVQQTLLELKAMGFRLAVDDFGTGYSSLSYLKRFPLDRLKVDKSFVQDLPQDTDNAAITRAIVAMAQSLKLDVTAEGVETREQLAFLQELGCQALQGFYFGRPLPASEANQFLFQASLDPS